MSSWHSCSITSIPDRNMYAICSLRLSWTGPCASSISTVALVAKGPEVALGAEAAGADTVAAAAPALDEDATAAAANAAMAARRTGLETNVEAKTETNMRLCLS